MLHGKGVKIKAFIARMRGQKVMTALEFAQKCTEKNSFDIEKFNSWNIYKIAEDLNLILEKGDGEVLEFLMKKHLSDILLQASLIDRKPPAALDNPNILARYHKDVEKSLYKICMETPALEPIYVDAAIDNVNIVVNHVSEGKGRVGRLLDRLLMNLTPIDHSAGGKLPFGLKYYTRNKLLYLRGRPDPDFYKRVISIQSILSSGGPFLKGTILADVRFTVF